MKLLNIHKINHKKMKSYAIHFVVLGILLSACEKDNPTPVKDNFEIRNSSSYNYF